MPTASEEIPDALAGERLDRVVAILTGVSRVEAAGLVAGGSVAVDGSPVTTRTRRVRAGEVIDVAWEPRAAVVPRADPAVVVPVVYEDRDLLVVDKPPGLVVHPGAGVERGTLVHGLLATHPDIAAVGDPARPGIVHRLDRDTSGLLVVARSGRAYDSLVAQLSQRSVERRYDALVWGHLEAPTGRVEAPIGRSRRDPTRMAVVEGGRPAATTYEVRERYDEPVRVSMLACRLETGRTHQIRVHLEAIGHPVVGDERYRGARQSFPVPRLFLHAASLAFDHPATGERLTFDSPLPEDLRAVLARLR